MTHPELAKYVAAKVGEVGDVGRFSRRHDISEGHIRAVIEGRVKPGPRLAKACGVYVVDCQWFAQK